jgi:hypothetical protein
VIAAVTTSVAAASGVQGHYRTLRSEDVIRYTNQLRWHVDGQAEDPDGPGTARHHGLSGWKLPEKQVATTGIRIAYGEVTSGLTRHDVGAG